MQQIKINGEIGFEVLASDIEEVLNNANGDIELLIDSPGGSVFEGVTIFNLLRDYNKGKITAIINGVAASMSSYIAMVADELKVYDNSTFMIHNAWGVTIGDYRDMQKTAEILQGLTKLLAKQYALKTGLNEKEVQKMMDEESWFFGEEIVKSGFADSVIKTEKQEDKQSALALAKEKFKNSIKKIKEKEEGLNDEKVAALMKDVVNSQQNGEENSKKAKIELDVKKLKLKLLKENLNG
jgi:ATP-dependent Clp endopeptidase proteolytic subunit ClpP